MYPIVTSTLSNTIASETRPIVTSSLKADRNFVYDIRLDTLMPATLFAFDNPTLLRLPTVSQGKSRNPHCRPLR